MNLIQRDKLRKIIELASELLKDSEKLSTGPVSYALDPHDDVPPAVKILDGHYSNR